MSCWGDEIDAAVDSRVRDTPLSGDVHFLLQELLKLFIDVLRYRFPTVVIIDLVSKAWCVHNSQLHLYSTLFNNMGHRFYVNSFGNLLIPGPACAPSTHLRLEECIQQCRLSQSAMTNNHDVEVKASLHGLLPHLLDDGVYPDVAQQSGPTGGAMGGVMASTVSWRVVCPMARSAVPSRVGQVVAAAVAGSVAPNGHWNGTGRRD